jgi:hypothetical protein
MSQAVHRQQQYHPTVVRLSTDTRDELRSTAKQWADNLGSLRGSIESGDGNTAGRFGELLFTEIHGGRIADDYEYDIVYNNLTVDVKTKRRTVAAKPRYEASIPDFNPDQDCDLYYFISIRTNTDYRVVDLMGYISPEEYHSRATFRREGEKDPDNGFVFSADCYNLEYGELQRHHDLPKEIHL